MRVRFLAFHSRKRLNFVWRERRSSNSRPRQSKTRLANDSLIWIASGFLNRFIGYGETKKPALVVFKERSAGYVSRKEFRVVTLIEKAPSELCLLPVRLQRFLAWSRLRRLRPA